MSNGVPTFAGCKKTDTTGMNAEQIAAANCKDAAICYQDTATFNATVSTYNDNQKQLLATAVDAYNTAKALYTQNYNNWKNKTGAYAKYAVQDGMSHDFVASDYGTCWWGENDTDATTWCVQQANKLGYDGANYAYKPGSWGWCSGRYGDFACAKPQNIQLQQQQEYNAAQPVFTTPMPTEANYPLAVPEPQSASTDISCCVNYIAVKGDVSGTSQICSQVSAQAGAGAGTPPTPPAPSSNPTPPNNSPTFPTTTEIYLGVALGFICCMLCLISVLYYFYSQSQ